MLALAEDVGRHNAVDKVIGMTALDKVDFAECFLTLSGRMSGDVAFKAAKVGLPIIASLAAALSSGIESAKESRITSYNVCYTKLLRVWQHQRNNIKMLF